MPSSGPSGEPAARRASAAWACLRAASGQTALKAFNAGWLAAIAARYASVTSTLLRCRVASWSCRLRSTECGLAAAAGDDAEAVTARRVCPLHLGADWVADTRAEAVCSAVCREWTLSAVWRVSRTQFCGGGALSSRSPAPCVLLSMLCRRATRPPEGAVPLPAWTQRRRSQAACQHHQPPPNHTGPMGQPSAWAAC